MLPIHIFAAIFAFSTVMKADKDALEWMRGRRQVLSAQRVRMYHILTWAGLGSLIVSGFFLMLPMAGYLLTQPLFIMKLLFVAVLFVNAFIIDRYSYIAAERPFASLSWDERWPLFTSGAISAVSWAGTLILALMVFG